MAVTVWKKLIHFDLLPENSTVKQFLWALAFLKIYAKENVLASCAKVDAKTFRKAVWKFIEAIAELETHVVRVFKHLYFYFH